MSWAFVMRDSMGIFMEMLVPYEIVNFLLFVLFEAVMILWTLRQDGHAIRN
jgi:hypothetical protein